MNLQIDLQEGFDHATVLIRLDGCETVRKQNVSTRTQIGFADSITLDVPSPTVRVEVEIPGLAANSVVVDARGTPYVGVTVNRDNQIAFSLSQTPFGYL